MDELLKGRIAEKLEGLSDDNARQLLDYMEFLESKHNRSSREATPLERLAENVEGTLKGSRIGGAAVKGTAQIVEAAGSLMRGFAAAGKAVVDEFQKLEEELATSAKAEEPESGTATGAPDAGPQGEEPGDEGSSDETGAGADSEDK
ncbi:MAG: hypothetical protein AMS18_05000 [Gemmatimonas sp. SG8_17]|nr:MAG: hypothetical protein AMS18_05000 [Gemmatimonas sp. SG8_17]